MVLVPRFRSKLRGPRMSHTLAWSLSRRRKIGKIHRSCLRRSRVPTKKCQDVFYARLVFVKGTASAVPQEMVRSAALAAAGNLARDVANQNGAIRNVPQGLKPFPSVVNLMTDPKSDHRSHRTVQ